MSNVDSGLSHQGVPIAPGGSVDPPATVSGRSRNPPTQFQHIMQGDDGTPIPLDPTILGSTISGPATSVASGSDTGSKPELRSEPLETSGGTGGRAGTITGGNDPNFDPVQTGAFSFGREMGPEVSSGPVTEVFAKSVACSEPESKIMSVDPSTFKVIQGRSKEAPNPQKVKELQHAIERGDAIPPPVVYQDDKTGEWFSPDGAHRQAAHAGLGRNIQISLVTVENARQRAERESCRANTGNGLSASRADRKFQLKKACELHHQEKGQYPNPSELAVLTGTSHPVCSAFLRELLAPEQTNSEEIQLDEVKQKEVTNKLQKVIKLLEDIKLGDDWIAGEQVKDMVSSITAKAKSIGFSTPRGPEVSIETLEAFRKKHRLSLERLAELLGLSSHTTVSRWIKGKSNMTDHHKRSVAQLLALSDEDVGKLLEGNRA